MMKYKLDPSLLFEATEPFDFSNPPVDPLDLVADLAEIMLKEGGIGIAANQCGLPYRVFVIKTVDELIKFVETAEDKLDKMRKEKTSG